MDFRTALIKTHSDGDGELSWTRVGCSIILLTGVFLLVVQLLLAVVVILLTSKGMEELAHIEWMQPISLIGVALAGKVTQKKIEKKNVEPSQV
tara:strand:- start:32 stop:310 length:279 start_codon:yes stop_codon:yes gene_type:complete